VKRLATLAAVALLTLSSSARAQFTIGSVLDNGPIHFGAGLNVVFTRFGQNVVVTAETFAVLHGAQSIIDAMIPELNRRLDCGKGNRNIGAAITQIQANADQNSLTVTANAHVTGCGRLASALVNGDVAVSSIVEPVVVRNAQIQLRTKQTTVQPVGLSLVALGTNRAEKEITAQIDQYVGTINKWLNKQFLNSSLQRQVKTYKLQIDFVRLTFQGGDLMIRGGLSGQVPISYVDRQLTF
jgi:hypothetical protein